MTISLPRPGSVWRNNATGKLMRVVLSGETLTVGHDCELTADYPITAEDMESWSSTPGVFLAAHTEVSAELYPKTATL